MTECDEIADNMKCPPRGTSLAECVRLASRALFPDESSTVVDEVGYSLWRRSERENCDR